MIQATVLGGLSTREAALLLDVSGRHRQDEAMRARRQLRQELA